MAAVNIIRGGVETDKSGLCIEQIEKVHKQYPEKRCIMLVPNHYSYETEKVFVKKFGGTGLNNIEVVTLRRLAMNMLSKSALNYITPAGRYMLIYKAVKSFCDSADKDFDPRLVASMKKRGFTDTMSSLISEFKRYLAEPDKMLEKAETIKNNKLLKNKLTAATRIYALYLDYIEKSEYTDSEDDNIRLADAILKSDSFNPDTYVWVDKFLEFSPQQLMVLNAMAQRGARLTICVNDTNDENEIYLPMKGTAYKIRRLADTFGLGELIDAEPSRNTQKSPELEFLLKNWNGIDMPYENDTRDIELFLANDTYSETRHTARIILDAVREDGMRYRDIAVLCGNTEEYEKIIDTVFSEYKIPHFSDSKITLDEHPIAMQILSVFDIFENDWSYESVFGYIKSGFIYSTEMVNGRERLSPIDADKISRLENHVLKYGIRGKKRWLSEDKWIVESSGIADAAFEGDPENAEARTADAEDDLRREIAKPLKALYDKVKGRHTAEELARSIFEFCRDINLDRGLEAEIHRLNRDGYVTDAEQFTRLWNLLMDVLNQTAVVLKDEKLTFSEFGEYMKIGLSQCEIRIIPSAIDQVYVGSVEKSSAARVKVLIVVGANDGTFPNEIPTEGFFSNEERNELAKNYGTELAPDTHRQLETQYFKVFAAMSAAQEKLYLSRPLHDSMGKSFMASGMINNIKRIFPKLKEIYDVADDTIYISTPEATVHDMILKRGINNHEKNALWEALYEWYSSQDEWKSKIALTDRADWYVSSETRLDSELAKKLYASKCVYSASRLNTYALCPYKYFLHYGLHLRERDEWEISSADIGSYAHEVIRSFCKKVEGDAETDEDKLMAWRSLEDKKRDELLDKIISDTCKNIENSRIAEKEKTVSIFRRTGRNIKNAAKTVHMALSGGKYVQKGMEFEFNMPINENADICGKIDRVDMLSDGRETRVRIIDYKTGKTTFDIVNIANGVDMQMVIYAIAAKNAAVSGGEEARVTGIYYNRVHNSFSRYAAGTSPDKIVRDKEKALRLDGVTFVKNDNDISDADESMNCSLSSKFLDIDYNKNGSLSKSKEFSVRSNEEIEGLMTFVKNEIVKTDGNIRDGGIACEPYTNTKNISACDYCEYGEVCSFCNKKTSREPKGSKAECWEAMRKIAEKEDGVNGDSMDE